MHDSVLKVIPLDRPQTFSTKRKSFRAKIKRIPKIDKPRFFRNRIQWEIYQEKFLLILFFVVKFVKKLKMNLKKYKLERLKPYHYHIIDDLATIDERLIKADFAEQMKLQLEEKIHFRSKKVGLFFLKIKFCKIFIFLFNINFLLII